MEGGLKALPLKTRAGQAPNRQTVRARANPAIRAAHARARAVKAEVHSREGRTIAEYIKAQGIINAFYSVLSNTHSIILTS